MTVILYGSEAFLLASPKSHFTPKTSTIVQNGSSIISCTALRRCFFSSQFSPMFFLLTVIWKEECTSYVGRRLLQQLNPGGRSALSSLPTLHHPRRRRNTTLPTKPAHTSRHHQQHHRHQQRFTNLTFIALIAFRPRRRAFITNHIERRSSRCDDEQFPQNFDEFVDRAKRTTRADIDGAASGAANDHHGKPA